MAVTLYSNQDFAAPVLTGTAGSLIAIFDAVLIDGYGTSANAGWTKAFSGTNIAVYRASPTPGGASGVYIRVDDTNATYAVIQAFKTMSDLDTGTEGIPSGTPAYTNSSVYWIKSATSDSTARPWAMIADPQTFYLNIAADGADPDTLGSDTFIFGAGDYNSFVPGNTYNYFIAGTHLSTLDSSLSLTDTQGTYGLCLMGRAQDLTAGKQSRMWIAKFGNTESTGSVSHFSDSSYTGIRYFYPGLVIEDAVQANITGQLRGVFGFAGQNSGTWLDNFGKLPDDAGGPDMIQFLASTTTASAIYIRLGDW